MKQIVIASVVTSTYLTRRMNPAFYDIKEKNGKRKIEGLKCVVQFGQTPKDLIHNRRLDISSRSRSMSTQSWSTCGVF